jgi:NitT/TauT family transport system substrate-binding protein
MEKKFWLILRLSIVLTLGLGVLTACGGDDDKDKDKANTAVSIQLSWVHESEFAGIYAAVEEGFYAREGLDVTILEGGFDDTGAYMDPIALLENGTVTFAVSSGEQILSARAAGSPIVMFAQVFQLSPRVFMSLVENDITKPEDFVGKRVGRRSDLAAILDALYNTAGVNAEDVIEITDSTLINFDALINGEIDVMPGFITSEAIELELAGHQLNNVVLSDYGIEDFQNVLVTTQTTIDENPDVVEQFLRATIDGIQFTLDNPEAAANLVQKYAPQADMAFTMASTLATVPLMRVMNTPIGTIDVDSWMPFAEILNDAGVLSTTDGVSEAYTLDFLNKVHAE